MANPTQREQRRGTRQYALAPAGPDTNNQRLWFRDDQRDPGKTGSGGGGGANALLDLSGQALLDFSSQSLLDFS